MSSTTTTTTSTNTNTTKTTSSSSNITLWTYFRSTASWRVRIALHLKQIDYTPIPINLVKGEQHEDDYIQFINPSGLLPTLRIHGHLLNQSLAIIEYLDETYPTDTPLLGKDPITRAKIRSLAFIIASDTQPIQNLRVLQKVSNDPIQRADWAKHWIKLGLQAYELAITHCASTYSVGNVISLADICLVPQVYNANRFGVDVSQFPIITRIIDNLATIEAFQRAHPDVQPDHPDQVQVRGS